MITTRVQLYIIISVQGLVTERYRNDLHWRRHDDYYGSSFSDRSGRVNP